jgi:hypothetical protein
VVEQPASDLRHVVRIVDAVDRLDERSDAGDGDAEADVEEGEDEGAEESATEQGEMSPNPKATGSPKW